MIRAEFFSKADHLNGFSVSGHSGYADAGEDIVCAALSSVIQTAVLGLMRVAGINVGFETDADGGVLELVIPDLSDNDRHNADMILDTMLCGIADLHEGYSDFIELEVK